MNWIGRADVYVLTALFAYSVAVFFRIFWRYSLARRDRVIDGPGRRALIANLSTAVSSLKCIALTAPYLGLAGTCFGLMGIFRGISMEAHAVRAMMCAILAAALVTTTAGILVAVSAICFYNFLCTRIDLLKQEVFNESLRCGKLPLRKRFSEFPAFALIAAPSLAMAVAALMSFASLREPKGMEVSVIPSHCEYEGDERRTVLHLTNAGKLLINNEEEDWRNLADRLSEIYSVREHRTLDLLVDKELSFQAAADVIDIVAGAESTTTTEPLNIKVRLITPAAINAGCMGIPSRFIPTPLARHSWR